MSGNTITWTDGTAKEVWTAGFAVNPLASSFVKWTGYVGQAHGTQVALSEQVKIYSEEELRHMARETVWRGLTVFNPYDTLSVNADLGSWDLTAANAATNTAVVFYPSLEHADEAVYLSSTLTNLKEVLPNGLKTCIRRIPITTAYGDVENHQQFSDHSYIEVGGMSLRTLKLSLLNWAGNRLPMGSANVSFQLVFGFPVT